MRLSRSAHRTLGQTSERGVWKKWLALAVRAALSLRRPWLNGWIVRFIIDGVITLPIALYGFLVFPDVPTTTRAFYLTEEVSRFSRPGLQNVHALLGTPAIG